MISQAQWDRFKDTVDRFHESTDLTLITWKSWVKQVPVFGEDQPPKMITRELKGQIQFNNYRTWPMTMFSPTGSEDKQSEVLWLNKSYLQSLNLLDSNGFFTYDPTKDIFIHEGVEYEAAGDSSVAQAGDRTLHFIIVLKRKNFPTENITEIPAPTIL